MMDAVCFQPVTFEPATIRIPERVLRLPSLRELVEGFLQMAGTKSDYLEEKIKNEVLGAVAFSAPATVYAGLWTSALSDTSTSATAGEASGGSYARVSLTNNTTNFATVTTGPKVNSTAWTFPAATANWGTVTHVGLFDVASGAGNMLLWADLTTAKAVNNGDTAQFNASDFSWTED